MPRQEILPTPTRFGDGVLRILIAGNELCITTTARLAGAIHSLTWQGQEYIDSTDHGRQLQSACAFDCALPGPFWAEAYNPTEAGSRRDGIGEATTSRLLEHHIRGNRLVTRTQMAFWLKPGEDSGGHPALNDTTLSRILLTKDVRVGIRGLPQVLDYRVSFNIPKQERRHLFAQFEALTGYMPYTFCDFYIFNPRTGRLESISDGPGEQTYPIVLATKDGRHAMGIFSHDQPSSGFASAGYGRFRFPEAQVVKWNCVFRVQAPKALHSGDYKYTMSVAWGTLAQVEDSLRRLHK